MNNVICCCGKSHECANRVLRAMEVISHAVLLEEKQEGNRFITTPDKLDPTEMAILQRFGQLAVMADEIYQARPPRKFFIQAPDGEKVESELDADNPFDALEDALQELTECFVCEEGK